MEHPAAYSPSSLPRGSVILYSDSHQSSLDLSCKQKATRDADALSSRVRPCSKTKTGTEG